MTAPILIACGRCVLRPWRLDDKAALLRYANNRNIWRNLRDVFPHPYTEADADAWLGQVTREPPEWLFAIEIGGEAVGGTALRRLSDVNRFTAELGYWLAEPFWGRGLMTDVVRAVTRDAFEQPDIYRIEAHVFSWNTASMRVLEKAGYTREALLERSAVKDGVLIDQVLYAVCRDPGLPYVPAPTVRN